ncbi:MAG: suppressor of fused domain protein [Janthinobacterium lividum]
MENSWGHSSDENYSVPDPHGKMHSAFRVLEFPPSPKHNFWIYSTLGMSIDMADNLTELHVFSQIQDATLIELLTVTASFHRNNATLGLHHTVNFGQPWQQDSACSFGYISLPYLDGEEIELFYFPNGHLHNLWLLPITEKERDYKIANGWNALEELFESRQFDYLDTNRISCA